MSDQTEAPVSYDYDEEAAGHADDFANRINENDAYIGQFTRAEANVSANKGTHGIYFEFEAPGGGKTGFTLYTKKADGSIVGMGMNKVQAMLTIFGLKSGLKGAPGKVQVYNEDTGQREEADGTVFPDLIGRDIGCVFQKELYTSDKDGSERSRMNLLMVFDAKTRLSASEIKERKVKPEKLDKALKGLKTIDKRKPKAAEPAQPAVGAPSGEY